jgi:hypothetical protein
MPGRQFCILGLMAKMLHTTDHIFGTFLVLLLNMLDPTLITSFFYMQVSFVY